MARAAATETGAKLNIAKDVTELIGESQTCFQHGPDVIISFLGHGHMHRYMPT